MSSFYGLETQDDIIFFNVKSRMMGIEGNYGTRLYESCSSFTKHLSMEPHTSTLSTFQNYH